MTVSCQEAMVEAQASDRIVVPASCASAATIESLRARLLSERAASKEARQEAHSIAQKVSELQTRLDAEIENRRKAEVAMNEVLEVLKTKGLAMEQVMANSYLPSESSASEEAAPIRGSKDGESDLSSGEEASHAHMEDKQSSANSQGSVNDAALTEDPLFEHQEGCISDDSSSDKTQINSEDTSGSDTSEVENEVVKKDEDGSSREQAMFTDPSKAHVSLLSTEGGEERGNEQSSELLSDSVKHAQGEVNTRSSSEACLSFANDSPCLPSANQVNDLVKHAEGEVNTQSSGEAGLSFANDSPCLPSANQINAHQEGDSITTSSEHLPGGHGGQQVDAYANEAPYPSNVENLNDMPMPVTENFPGPRPKDVHPYFFINNGYPYDMLHMYADKLHNVSSAEAPFSRGPMSFSNTSYQSRGHLSSKVAELGRYPQATISDGILSLVDDKNGKLGSILLALHLAKQQLKDEEQASSYMQEKFEAPLPIPFDGKPYPGFYEGVPCQPPYRPRKPEPHNAAPIIHFPMSPTSDHEVSPFERYDGIRRSSSTSAYYMTGYDPYLQPKGELHLGNGITLYTD